MKPKSGKLVKKVKPIEPAEVFAADEADPGKAAAAKAEQIQGKKGKYGSTDVKPYKPKAAATSAADDAPEVEDKDEEENLVDISFELKDEEGNPVAGVKFEIETPDGSVAKGTTDSSGIGELAGVEPGAYKLSLPEIHKGAW